MYNGIGFCEYALDTTNGVLITGANNGVFAGPVNDVYGTSVVGEVEFSTNGGGPSRLYNQWGYTYDAAGFIRGASMAFELRKLPGGTALLNFGLGQQYGPPIPSVQINASGQVSWSGGPGHSGDAALAAFTTQVGDKYYLHSAWGKYDLQIVRAGALVYSGINFYTGSYTLGGTAGFYGQNCGAPGNANNPKVKPIMNSVMLG